MMMGLFLSRLRNILMGIVMSMPGTFILEVLFMIVSSLVLPSSRFSFANFRVVFS